MKFKSYIPCLTVPIGLVMLIILVADATRGRFDSSTDIPMYAIWGIVCSLSLVSGLIRWNIPYVTIDESDLTVRGQWFSRQPSRVIEWGLIKRHVGRSFFDIKIELSDGKTIKIPINGMSGKSVGAILDYINSSQKSKLRAGR